MKDLAQEYFSNNKTLRIGARGSKLAVIQAEEIKNYILRSFQNYISSEQIEIVNVQTTGDKIRDRDIKEIGGKALFLKEIEEMLLQKQIDMAVHSMKDVPSILHSELTIDTSYPIREDERDVLIAHSAKNIKDLPQNALVGTSSPRRRAIMLKIRPDLQIVPFRGNVPTRIANIENNAVDATILALSGLNRLKIDISRFNIIDPKEMLPAVGQGALAIELRKENTHLKALLRNFNHAETEIKVCAERAFLQGIGGDCFTPIAAFARIEKIDTLSLGKNLPTLTLEAMILHPEGKDYYYTSDTINNISVESARQLGSKLASRVKTEAKELYMSVCKA